MSKSKCNPFDVSAAIASTLSQYSRDVCDDVKKAIDLTTKELLQGIKKDSRTKFRQHRGKYTKGWRQRTEYENNTQKRTRVYNATDYQLTHLLEKKRYNRGRTSTIPGRPHIEPNEKKASQTLEDRVIKAVEK
jgi:hypothetical protein